MTTPDFFVIGAAKSGTTSLHRYLDQHPGISMSRVKEPNFFAFLDGVPAFDGPRNLKRSLFVGDRRHNVSRDVHVPRMVWLHDALMRPNRASRFLSERLPRRFVRAVTPFARRLVFRKAGALDYTPLSAQLRTQLTSRFRDDILRLQDLLDRDLSHWLQEPS